MIAVRADAQLEAKLRAHAKKAGMSVGAFVRMMLRRAVISYEQEEAALATGPTAPARRRVLSRGVDE